MLLREGKGEEKNESGIVLNIYFSIDLSSFHKKTSSCARPGESLKVSISKYRLIYMYWNH